MNFTGATFSGGDVSFICAVFSGGDVSFTDAVFSGSRVSFDEARFSGSKVLFDGAVFSGGDVSYTPEQRVAGFNERHQTSRADTLQGCSKVRVQIMDLGAAAVCRSVVGRKHKDVNRASLLYGRDVEG
ncbi:hypothetical protein ABZU45_31750 [Streptomyces avermitilis]|uniref:hypothetical protein n=1 Tax=Streptomyces avermitilis TaxID=33903 RepID=UPI0033B71B9F